MDSLFVNPAEDGVLTETIDNNVYMTGIGGASTNGMKFILSNGSAKATILFLVPMSHKGHLRLCRPVSGAAGQPQEADSPNSIEQTESSVTCSPDDNSVRLVRQRFRTRCAANNPPQIVRSRLSNSMLGSGQTTPQDYRE